MSPALIPLRAPRVTLLAFASLCVLGLAVVLTAPRQEDPDFDWRACEVVTLLPGADPFTVETLVTRPLEERVGGIPDLDTIQAVSREGVAYIRVSLRPGSDYRRGFDRIREKVSEFARRLPPGALPPQVIDGDDLIKTTSFIVALTSKEEGRYDPLALLHYAKDVKRNLERLGAVESVELQGPPRDEIQVRIDLDRLAKWRVDPQRLQAALAARNVRLPTGKLALGDRQVLVEATGELSSLAEIEDIIVDVTAEGDAIRIRDVADVTRGSDDPHTIARLDQKRAVMLGVFLRKDVDVSAVSETIRPRLDRMRDRLPRGVQVDLVFDQADSVRSRFETLTSSLWQGMLLVVIVLLCFLGWRQSLVAASGIPITLLVAFLGMGATGTAFHQLSVVGVVIALGMLVDNIIVVVENSQDHLEMGDVTPFEAIARAAREVQTPLLSSTLTTVAAFVPLLLMGGDTGAFLYDMPLLVVMTLLSSLVVGLALTPLLCLLVFGGQAAASHGPPGLVERIRAVVFGAITRVFIALRRRRLLVAGFFLSTLVLAGVLVPRLGFQLFPKADRGLLVLQLELPAGTDIEATDRAAERLGGFLGTLPETDRVMAFAGRAVPHFYYNLRHEYSVSHLAQLVWFKKPTSDEVASTSDMAKRLRRLLPRVVPEAKLAVREIEQGPPIQAPIVLRVSGPDVAVLRREAARLQAVLEGVPGVIDARDTYGVDGLGVDVALDLDKATLLGLTRREVAGTLAALLGGSTPTSVSEGDEDRPVVLRIGRAEREDVEALDKIDVLSPFTGAKVALRQVGELELGRTLPRIERHGRVRSIDVEAWVEGRLASHALVDLKQRLEDYEPPAGYELEIVGENKEISDSFKRLAVVGLFAILLIYVILVAQFNSLVQPFTILCVLPLSLAGAMIGLWLTSNPIGLFAGVGCASLAGIVVNDAILLVEFVNAERATGKPLSDAIDEGTRRRVKPILSTTLTTIGGLIPLALADPVLWAPLCYVIAFGLGFSTVGTLVFLPMVYGALERLAGGGRKRRRRVLVVDDDIDVVEMVEDILSDGFDAEGTTDARHAIENVQKFDADAVVVDYMMPGRDGLSIVEGLRQVRPDVAIVMLTAHAGARVQGGVSRNLGAEAISRGADAFVSKTDVTDLPEVLEEVLRRPASTFAGRLLRRARSFLPRARSS